MKGIEVFRGQQAGAGVYYMVRLERRKHLPSGLPLNRLARILELGSARHKIPARAHWAPTLRQIVNVFDQQSETVQAEVLRRALRQVT